MYSFNVGFGNRDFNFKINAISALEIAGVFLDDIKSNYEQSTDIRGGRLKPLRKLTIDAKKRKGSVFPSKAMYDTGQSYESHKVKGNKNEAYVYVTNRRNGKVTNTNILEFQKNKFDRQVWGISERALERIRKRYLNGR